MAAEPFVCCRQVYLWLKKINLTVAFKTTTHKVLTVWSIFTQQHFFRRLVCGAEVEVAKRKLMFSDSFIRKDKWKNWRIIKQNHWLWLRVMACILRRKKWKNHIHFVASLLNIHQNTIRIIVQWKSFRCSYLQLHELDLLEWFNQMGCTVHCVRHTHTKLAIFCKWGIKAKNNLPSRLIHIPLGSDFILFCAVRCKLVAQCEHFQSAHENHSLP